MSKSISYMQDYISGLTTILEKIDLGKMDLIYERIIQAVRKEITIYVFGNGGSAATASHLICDLGKNARDFSLPRIKIISLNENMSIFSTYANDDEYESVFKEQIISLGEEEDITLAISGSGNSPNVLEGVAAAKRKNMYTIGFTGFQGGKLKNLADLVLVVPSNDMEIIEDIHLVLNHLLTGLLRGRRYKT